MSKSRGCRCATSVRPTGRACGAGCSHQPNSHVATLFRQQTGQTIHHYLTQVRVHHAAALIRQREKVEAVSLLVGYRSKKNFYLHFKQQIGVTPGVYKEVLIGLAPLADREPAVERQPKK